MRTHILLAGAAALAATMPALAQGQGKGKGQGGGNPAAEMRQGGGGGGKGAERRAGRENRQAERQNRSAAREPRQAAREQSRPQRQQRQAQRREDPRAQRQVERRAERPERRNAKAERRVQQAERKADRRYAREVRRPLETQSRAEQRAWRDASRTRDRAVERYVDRPRDDRRFWSEARVLPATGFGRACPPGLAKQNAFCMPPGQLRKAQYVGRPHPVARIDYNIPERYRYRFRDADDHYYRHDGGYVYRFDRGSNLVSRVIPLAATGLMVGEPLPLGYEVYNVPYQYRGLYADGGDYSYRYDDGAIYRVNSGNGLIETVVALLTSGALGGLGGLGVGDLLPGGYDVYNVPLEHRDTYYDTPDHLYRYADGNIYQVDPQSRIIEQIISLIA
ncbi:MAG: hypothetical protein ACK4K7_13100 [Allosphingosinicella sp.]|uniref:hypothetical protein n=1 Tax=Allosphingosinicella sp. TaxID=2823234 RepID=UPI003956812F